MDRLFANSILEWHGGIERKLPWKETDNPYFIWLSEIILQQTRVAQGLPYYIKFVNTFPTVYDLAKASEDIVMQCWKGLGYYSRARNLHATAKLIVDKYGGKFPTDYKDILDLKGIGPYTAAAIASFAFGIHKAVVDGNVLRVFTRYYGIHDPIDDGATVKEIRKQLDKLICDYDPAAFNQAIMDFGALHCKPSKPLCNSCSLQDTCQAYAENTVSQLPTKRKKLKKRERFFHFLHIEQKGKVLLQKRTEKDIWQSLYQFPLIETKNPKVLKDKTIKKELFSQDIVVQKMAYQLCYESKQTLSHQKIYGLVYKIELDEPIKHNKSFILLSKDQLSTRAFPRLLDRYLLIRYPESY